MSPRLSCLGNSVHESRILGYLGLTGGWLLHPKHGLSGWGISQAEGDLGALLWLLRCLSEEM